MLKAESIFNLFSELKPGQYITWPVYDGTDILEAKSMEEYVNTFFKTGTLMPIPVLNLGLDIYSVQAEYDDGHATHKVVIEGFITKPRKK